MRVLSECDSYDYLSCVRGSNTGQPPPPSLQPPSLLHHSAVMQQGFARAQQAGDHEQWPDGEHLILSLLIVEHEDSDGDTKQRQQDTECYAAHGAAKALIDGRFSGGICLRRLRFMRQGLHRLWLQHSWLHNTTHRHTTM